MNVAARASRSIVSHESVRCLQCGWIYSKPVFGGTAAKNPGCPMCSYVGWVRVELRVAGS
jgi:hypothetical protein